MITTHICMALEIYKALSHSRPFDPRDGAAGSGERHADGGFHAREESTETRRVRGPGSPAAAQPWSRHSFAGVVTPKSKPAPPHTLPSERSPRTPSAAGRDPDAPRPAPRAASWGAGNSRLCIHESRGSGHVRWNGALETVCSRAQIQSLFAELRPGRATYTA